MKHLIKSGNFNFDARSKRFFCIEIYNEVERF